MKIQAVVFDFDGVILDTEKARYDAWESIFKSYGVSFPLDAWIQSIGRSKYAIDPFDLLQELTGKTLDCERIRNMQRQKSHEFTDKLPLLSGVQDRIWEAVSLKIKLGVASCSSHEWVRRHLEKRGLLKYFDVLVCREDTESHKPSPIHYLTALKKLKCDSQLSVAIEDSQLGIEAAVGAGMYCIAVACSFTKNMDLSLAHQIETSLEKVSFSELNDFANVGKLHSR